MTGRGSVITAIDVGTRKVCTLIARWSGADGFAIIGVGVERNEGMKKGLVVDLDAVQRSVEEAHQFAFNLSLEAVIPLPENISFLLRRGHQEAYSLALNAGVSTPDTVKDLVRKANIEMLGLSGKLDDAEKKGASSS